MKLISHHLRCLPNVLENPNISLSPHNPQERERERDICDSPKSLASNRILKTFEGDHQHITNTARLNPLHPSL